MHRGVLWVFVFVLGRCRVFVGTRLALWLWLVASFCVLSFCLPRYPGDVGTCGPAHYNQGTEFRRNSLPYRNYPEQCIRLIDKTRQGVEERPPRGEDSTG